MFQVAMVRNGKVCEKFTVSNLVLFDAKLDYIRRYAENGAVFFVMSEKDDCNLASLSTGNVGEIARGLA